MRSSDIRREYDKNSKEAEKLLKEMPAYQKGSQIKINGLNGWVFEQVIADSLRKTIKGLKIGPQPKLFPKGSGRRARPDFLLNNKIFVEVKTKGLFPPFERFEECVDEAKSQGRSYLYITMEEGSPKYFKETKGIFGVQNSFFLEENGDWERFVHRIRQLLA